MNKLTHLMFEHATQIAREMAAKAVMFDVDSFDSKESVQRLFESSNDPLVIVTRSKEHFDSEQFDHVSLLRLPKVPLTRQAQIKFALIIGVAEKLFARGDLVVCLSGVQDSNRLDMLTVLKVGDEPEFFLTDEANPLPPDVEPAVFERLLTIASELAVEGREKKAVGLIFVVGDSEKVMECSRQLVFNPFRGYSDEERNILSGRLDETIKEFAAIDGAFIIRGDGVMMAAGRYLMPQGKPAEPLRPGLGTRHESAAAITATTDAVAIVLSQSTATISVYNSGRLLTEIERVKNSGERWIRSRPVSEMN